MPHFYFHTADGTREQDREGLELPDRDAARVAGIRYAGALLTHEPEMLSDGRDFRVEVTDDTGTLLYTIITLAVDAPAVEELG